MVRRKSSVPLPQVKGRSRHWKQKFDPNADHVWRKSILWNGELTLVGTPVPKDIDPHRLKLLWRACYIELEGYLPGIIHDPHAEI